MRNIIHGVDEADQKIRDGQTNYVEVTGLAEVGGPQHCPNDQDVPRNVNRGYDRKHPVIIHIEQSSRLRSRVNRRFHCSPV